MLKYIYIREEREREREREREETMCVRLRSSFDFIILAGPVLFQKCVYGLMS